MVKGNDVATAGGEGGSPLWVSLDSMSRRREAWPFVIFSRSPKGKAQLIAFMSGVRHKWGGSCAV